MEKATISFRIDECLRDAVRGWARDEQRTTSNFMESLLYREKARRDGSTVTLDSLDMKLERLLGFHTIQPKQVKAKSSDSSRDREVLEQVLAIDRPETLSEEVWKTWVIHLRAKRNNKLDVATAQKILERWQLAEDNGYDLDELVELAIQRNHSDAVYESHIDKPKGGGKTVADAQSRILDECVNARRV